jgi:cell division transport system permease protein
MSLLFKGRLEGALRKRTVWWRHPLSYAVDHLRQAVATLGELWRTPAASLMTMTVLGLSLSLPSALYLLHKNAQSVSGAWNNAAEITLFLRKDVSEHAQQNFVKRVGLYPEVADVSYVSSQQALQEFKVISGFGNALDYLDDNPLPPVVLVSPGDSHNSPERAKALLDKLEAENEVEMGKLDIAWLERLNSIVALLRDAFSALAILLMLSVILIVGNTIRLNILNRREEIEVMKLVGATDSFIQRPFLYTGLWYGVIGAFVAWIAIALILWWLEAAINRVSQLYQSDFHLVGLDLTEALFLLVLSAGLGLSGSWISVRRHISEIEPT